MKQKTISGHYGAVYNLTHNNRDFVPKNVDRRRIAWNYNCVSAGRFAYPNPDAPHHISEFRARYKELNALYWSERSIAQTITYKRYPEHLEHMRRYSRAFYQIPDQQGILDWIEAQKSWIQKEMKQRYGWDREYKGSHPRGDLSTPDYQVARAKERPEEHNILISQSLQDYQERVEELTVKLDSVVDEQWQNATNQQIIDQYLQICTDEEYDALLKTASTYLDRLAIREQQKVFADLDTKISPADRNQSLALSLKNIAHQNTQNRNG